MMNALYISLIIFFVNYCFAPGGIFGFIGEYLDSDVPSKFMRWITKPLITCTVCMAPYYTYFVSRFIPELITDNLLFTMGVVGGINVIISTLIGFLNSYSCGLEKDPE